MTHAETLLAMPASHDVHVLLEVLVFDQDFIPDFVSLVGYNFTGDWSTMRQEVVSTPGFFASTHFGYRWLHTKRSCWLSYLRRV